MSGATFEPVDRLREGGQIRGVQQVQALRRESTVDVNKGTSSRRARGPNDEFLRGVNCGAVDSSANRGASSRSIFKYVTREAARRNSTRWAVRTDHRAGSRGEIEFSLSLPRAPDQRTPIRRYVLHHTR